MGKPRKKGMRRGYLKRFSAQAVNGGRCSPKTFSASEQLRPKRSMGFGSPLNNKLPPELPRTQGATVPVKERTERWHALVKSDRVLYGAHENYSNFNGRSIHQIKQAGVKFAPKLNCGLELEHMPYKLCFEGNAWYWLFTRGNEVEKKSIIYSSAKRAEYVFLAGDITWVNST